MFAVEIRQPGQAWLVSLRGELDFSSAVQLREAVERVVSGLLQPGLMVIDCAGLGFCDSSGISSLIAIHQWLSARGSTLRLAAVPPAVARIFRLTGLDQLVGVYPTASEALAVDGGGAAASSPADTSASTQAAVQG
ncbi:STAS domain-containing protein [Streptomyces sp. NPDC059717]|uniref:STAS domain-containing protein n=1 Tax=Streptomyces sp. NPDC059717 TaxID=3346922 RepID=UPI0036962203